MVSVDIEQGYGDHANLFLAEKTAIFSLIYQESVKGLESWRLPHFLPTNIIETVRHLVGVPWHSSGSSTRNLLVLFDFRDHIFDLLECFLPVSIDRIDSETNVEWFL